MRIAKSVNFYLILLSTAALTYGNYATAIEVAFEEDSSLPLIYINVAIKGGAVDDPEGQSGISNFVAEMLMRGTKSRTKEQIDLELDQMGARLAVETRAEALILRGAVLAGELKPFLKLVKDLVLEPAFPENEIRKLKTEIISEISEALGRDSSLASRWANRFLFHGHPYGKPVEGRIADIKNISRAHLVAHYDKLFRDRRLLVIGTGDAREADISAFAKELGLARAGGEAPTPLSSPQDSRGRRLLIVDKPERTQTQIFGGQIGMMMTDPQFFPLYLANHAFGGQSFSARMMVEIRVKRGWSYGAYSYFRHGRQPRSWLFHLFPATKDTPQALAQSLQMIQELREKGLSAREFEFAKRSLINGAGFMYNTPQKRVDNSLLERTLDLPDGFMKTYGSNLEKVTLAEVNQAVVDYFKPDNLSITVLGTAKDIKEALAKAAGMAAAQIEVVPYTED